MTITYAALFLFIAATDSPPKPADVLKHLIAESESIEKTLYEELRANRSNDGVNKANDKFNSARETWEKSALDALRKNPELPEAVDVIERIMAWSDVDVPELVGLLRKHHSASPDLGKLFHSLVQSRNKEGREFIEEMAEKSPVQAVRAQAAYDIGWQAKWRITEDGTVSLGFGTKLTEEERKQMEERAQKYLNLAAKYDDAPMASRKGKVGPTARAELLGLKNSSFLQIGKVAPDIAGEAVDGKKLKLSEQRGKITVLVFWASWCGPCMRMVPHEKKLVERMKGKPFALIGVNGDHEKEKATEAAKKHEMTWPSFWDAADRPDGPITKAWNVNIWPTVYLLDADGVIRYMGHSDAKEKLDELVDELVGKLEKK